AALFGELVAEFLRARVLPDDGVGVGAAGVLVPDDGGLALVGDADGSDVAGAGVGGAQDVGDDGLGVAPDLHGVVLDPAGLREELGVLALRGDDGPGAVEEDAAGGGGALVDGGDVARHGG